MEQKAKIISGFPGVGKSTAIEFLKFFNIECYDSDSSKFSWIVSEDGEKERNPNFVKDYVDHIKSLLDKDAFVFVSTHEDFLMALSKERIKFEIVYPSVFRKEEFAEIYEKRGNAFGKIVIENWNTWINAFSQYSVPQVILVKGNFLIHYLLLKDSDLSERINEYYKELVLNTETLEGVSRNEDNDNPDKERMRILTSILEGHIAKTDNEVILDYLKRKLNTVRMLYSVYKEGIFSFF